MSEATDIRTPNTNEISARTPRLLRIANSRNLRSFGLGWRPGSTPNGDPPSSSPLPGPSPPVPRRPPPPNRASVKGRFPSPFSGASGDRRRLGGRGAFTGAGSTTRSRGALTGRGSVARSRGALTGLEFAFRSRLGFGGRGSGGFSLGAGTSRRARGALTSGLGWLAAVCLRGRATGSLAIWSQSGTPAPFPAGSAPPSGSPFPSSRPVRDTGIGLSTSSFMRSCAYSDRRRAKSFPR
jgi:hypothetical protein